MTIDSANDVPDGSEIEADVCVIGAGAAGITLALELNRSARKVLLLEAGGFDHDPATEADSYAVDLVGLPQPNPEPSRGRWLGGSTNLWFGRIAQLDPIDFEHRPWVRSSGWPITPQDIEPWLRVAGEILEVDNFDKLDVRNWPHHRTIDAFSSADTSVGVFLWSNERAMRMGRHHRAQLASSPRVTVLTDATATALIANGSGRQIGQIQASGPRGNRFVIRSNVTVLAAGGLENARLLLASNHRSGSGVGNDHDQVGRYFMDHPRGEGSASVSLRGCTPAQLAAVGLLGERSRSEFGKVQLRMTFTEAFQRRRELLNNSMHAHLVSGVHGTGAYQSARRLVAVAKRERPITRADMRRDLVDTLAGAPAIASHLVRRMIGRVKPTAMVFVDQMEQEPDPDSRITVDFRRPDRFGLPRVQLDWKVGDSTTRSQQVMHECMQQALQRLGVPNFSSPVLDGATGLELWDMKHPSGTTRMSATSRHGVVDADCRVHGVSNLFVAGSSVFPTVGHANPTLTIIALAARLAAHIDARSAP